MVWRRSKKSGFGATEAASPNDVIFAKVEKINSALTTGPSKPMISLGPCVFKH